MIPTIPSGEPGPEQRGSIWWVVAALVAIVLYVVGLWYVPDWLAGWRDR